MAQPTKRTTRKATAAGKSMAETVADAAGTVQDAGETVVRRVGQTARNAGRAAVEKAEEARDALTDTGERLSERLKRAASRAQNSAHDIPARVSEGVSDAVDRVRGSAVGDIAADLRHMARRNPGVFMAGAALAGFALAKLLSHRTARDD